MACENLDVGPDAFDERGSDEDSMEGVAEPVDVEIDLEAVELPAIPVSSNRQVDQIESSLVRASVEHVGGAQDHAGTGAEHGQPVDQASLEVVEEPARREQPRHRGALASGQHDRVETVEVVRRSYQRCTGAELLETLTMHVEGPLQGEYANGPADSRSGGVRSPVRHIAG